MAKEKNWLKVLALKAGIVGFGLYCFHLGATYNNEYKALNHNLFRGHQRAALNFHNDGYNITINNPTDESGDFETWIAYNDKRVEVYKDLLPSNSTIYSALENRIDEMDTDDLQSLRADLTHLYSTIDERLGTQTNPSIYDFRSLTETNPAVFHDLGPNFKSYVSGYVLSCALKEIGGFENGRE